MVGANVGLRQQPLHAAPTDVADGPPADGFLSHLFDGAVSRAMALLGHRLAGHGNDLQPDRPAELWWPSRSWSIGQALQPLLQETTAPPLDGLDIEIQLQCHRLSTVGCGTCQDDPGSQHVSLSGRVRTQPRSKLGFFPGGQGQHDGWPAASTPSLGTTLHAQGTYPERNEMYSEKFPPLIGGFHD